MTHNYGTHLITEANEVLHMTFGNLLQRNFVGVGLSAKYSINGPFSD
jgi:hypothetical protein